MSRSKKKNSDYFGGFCLSAGYATRAAEFLHETLSSFSHEDFKKYVDEMHEIEHAADANMHEMMRFLAHEFMPPVEREDIVALAQELDNVVDAIDDIMRRIYMFDVSELRPGVLDFTDLIIRCCRTLEEAVTEFRNFKTSKTIHDKLVAVNTLESDGDALHSECIHRLFIEKVDARSTLIWMMLFDDFEMCLDACEDAAEVISSVIMKNS